METFTKAKIILFSSIVLSATTYGITLPLFPFIIDEMGGRGIHMGMLITAYGIMQFIFAPFWGKLSDKTGRKPLLICGVSGIFIAMLLFGFSNSLWMLYIAKMFLGMLGSSIFAISTAYIIDITDKENRAGGIGKIGASIGLGIIMGPGIGSLLAYRSLFFPFFVSAGFALATLFLVIFFLPESLKRSNTVSKTPGTFYLKEIFFALFSPLGFGLLMLFAVHFSKSNFSSIYGLYALIRFGHDTLAVGFIFVLSGIVYTIVQGFCIGSLIKKFGEEKLIIISLIGNLAGFSLMVMAYNLISTLLAVLTFIIFNSILKPSALTYISNRTEKDQGSSMGLADAYMSLGRIAGPAWAGFLFDINILLPYISGAIFFLAIILIIFKIKKFRIYSLNRPVFEE